MLFEIKNVFLHSETSNNQAYANRTRRRDISGSFVFFAIITREVLFGSEFWCIMDAVDRAGNRMVCSIISTWVYGVYLQKHNEREGLAWKQIMLLKC